MVNSKIKITQEELTAKTIRRIFNRGKLTKSDTKILMGIARQNLWIANKKKDV